MTQKKATSRTHEFLAICEERGLSYQISDQEGLNTQLLKGKDITAYIGFDATASAFHVGNLMQINMLRWWRKCGFTPIALIGGGTTLIGDPSGKDKQRKMMTLQDIEANAQRFKQSLSRFFNGDKDLLFANNADWLTKLGYLEILREVGSHFSISRMLSFDSVRLRLEREHSISFLEFNYMVLQAYDFLHLARHAKCILQIGGSDQWGNIVCGIELNRRKDNRCVFGVTTSLITNAKGQKMGKSEDGAVWLDGNMVNPFDFWQFWRNSHDHDVCRFLRLYSEVPIQTITRFETLAGEELNEAKILLANEVTSLVHGKEKAGQAQKAASSLFASGSEEHADLPRMTPKTEGHEGSLPLTMLLCQAGLCQSQSEARRLIAGKGVRWDGNVVEDVTEKVAWQRGQSNRLSVGKKRHLRVDWPPEI